MYQTPVGGSRSPENAPSASPEGGGGKKQQSGQQRIRRRNRLITSCLECRRRKLKCDKGHPCTNCTRFSRDCVFLAPALDPQAQLKLAEIKEKMGTLERTLEEDVARRQSNSGMEKERGSGLPGQDLDDDSDGGPTPDDEKDLEPTPFALSDVAYDEDVDDDMVDLGIQIGKMRITERLGGFVRPKMTDELKQGLAKLPAEGMLDPSMWSGGGGASLPKFDIQSALRPGRDFVAPSSSFFFAPDPRKPSLMHYLPSKTTADRLLKQYWVAVHPIARILHRPSFERKYDMLWKDVSVGKEPKASFQAILFSALLAAAVSISEDTIIADYGVGKAEFVDNFRQGAEAALSRANFLRTTKLETIQALVMYLIPLCRSEISRAHSALVGTAVRLAECMGLHRDGSQYGLNAVEVHVRRLVWYQLCFLDIRTCDQTGPRPQIRADDFDTKLPLNVNDADLESSSPPTSDSDQFTEMTVSRIRFECNEMHRLIWVERQRIERKKTTLTSLLGKVEKFRTAMEKTYYPMLDAKDPLQYFAIQVYSILSLRMHTMILHRYASTNHRIMPDRLRNIMVSSGTLVIEHAMNVETNPVLKIWSWYSGALQQYHFALLLLGELYVKPPDTASEARIWRCLDYAFELPSQLGPLQKSRHILTEVAVKNEAYQAMRRLKTPTALKTADQGEKMTNRVWSFDENYRREYLLKKGITLPMGQTMSKDSLSPASPASAQASTTSTSIPGYSTGLQPTSSDTKATHSSGVPTGPLSQASAYGQQLQPQHQHQHQHQHQQAQAAPNRAMPSFVYGMGILPQSSSAGIPYSANPPQGYPGPGMLDPNGPVPSGMAPIDVAMHRGSDASSTAALPRHPSSAGDGRSPDSNDVMLDIDWNEWDKLFPPDANNPTGDLNIPPFSFPEYAAGGTVGWAGV